jgi:hypothetical protein
MEIEGNKVLRDGVAIAEFNDKWKKTYLVDDLKSSDKMQIGRDIANHRKKVEGEITKEKPKDSTKPIEAPKKSAESKALGDANPDVAPWEIWPDCPKPGPEGDKTPEVVEWVYANQRAYYDKRYAQRKTCIKARLASERRTWVNMGEDYAGRGMHIGDCPNYATEQQSEYFRIGYRRYLEQTSTR